MRTKIRFTVIVANLILILAQHTPVNRAEASPSYLVGIHAVNIVIETLDKAAEDEQITGGMLEDQVLVTLKSKVPALKYDRSASSYIYVNLTMISTTYQSFGNLDLEVHRSVEILVGADHPGQTPLRRQFATATVWSTGTLFADAKGHAADKVGQILDRLLEELLADYFRANP
jgi:hypothetical protein